MKEQLREVGRRIKEEFEIIGIHESLRIQPRDKEMQRQLELAQQRKRDRRMKRR